MTQHQDSNQTSTHRKSSFAPIRATRAALALATLLLLFGGTAAQADDPTWRMFLGTCEHGVITPDPIGEGDGSLYYAPGTVVTLTCVPETDHTFIRWEVYMHDIGGWVTPQNGYENPAAFTVGSDHLLVNAVCEQVKTLTYTVEGAGDLSFEPVPLKLDAGVATFLTGASVTVTAVPGPGHVFDHWTADLSGTTNPQSLTMDADKSVTAVFASGLNFPGYAYLETSVIGHGLVELDPPGHLYPVGTTVRVRAVAQGNATLDHWEGDLAGAEPEQDIVMDGHKTAMATFLLSSSVRFGAVGPGVVKDSVNVVQAIGDDFTDGNYGGWSVWGGSFTAANGYLHKSNTTSSGSVGRVFTYPDGVIAFSYRCTDIASTDYCYVRSRYTPAEDFVNLIMRPGSIHLSKKVGATWTALASTTIGTTQDAWYDVRIVLDGSHVEVWRGLHGAALTQLLTSEAAAPLTTNYVNFGVYNSANVFFDFDDISVSSLRRFDTAEQISVAPVPVTGASFYRWSGERTDSVVPVVITTDADHDLTALMRQTGAYALATDVTGGGTVTRSPDQWTYAPGSVVALQAVADPEWQFDHWEGALTGSANPQNVTMNADTTVRAVFVPVQYTLTVTTWREGSVSTPGGTYNSGTNVVITAEAATDTRFDHWEGDVLVGQENNAQIGVLMDANKSLMAVFVRRMTLETSVIGDGSVDPPSATVDQGEEVELRAIPATDWAFRGWIGDVESTANPLTVTVDAPMSVVAEFTQVTAAISLDLVADLNALLTATGDTTAELVFDEGNGIPDAAEMMVLEAVLENAAYNRVPFGGTGHRTVYNAWAANLTQAALDLPSQSAAIQRAIAAYMTLGTDGHTAWAVAAALEVASVTLDPVNYTGIPKLGADGDADGDTHWNRLEWKAVLDEYQVTIPTMTHAGVYVVWALDPELPTDENVDIGMDLPDGDGTDWDYSYLPQGTVTFQSAQDVPIEVRILDPPGREDVPVTLGTPVQIPLGAELLVTLAEGANPDWFYKWSAPGNMIHGSGEKTERFRLMCSGTIQPDRRDVYPVGLPPSPQGDNSYTFQWSAVGPFGHMVTPGSSAGGNTVDVPEGAFLKLRAYQTKEPPGGAGASTAGSDKSFAPKWELWDDIYNGEYYVYGSSPSFGNFAAIGYSIKPIFGNVYAPHGWMTLTASCNEGGYPFIAGAGPFNNYIAPVNYQSASVPKPAVDDLSHYAIEVDLLELPGFEDAGVGEGFLGYYTGALGSMTVQLMAAKMLVLETDVKVEGGGGGTPAEAGHVTAFEARKWYSPTGNELVQLDASAHVGFYFTEWSGDGDAYLANLFGEPDTNNPVPLDNPDVPITDSRIWIAMEGGTQPGTKAVSGSGSRTAQMNVKSICDDTRGNTQLNLMVFPEGEALVCGGEAYLYPTQVRDDCGNVVEVDCDGGCFHFKYNGTTFGMCQFVGGDNALWVEYTEHSTSEYKRFYQIWHLNIDNSVDDNGNGRRDFIMTKLNAISGTVFERCCKSSAHDYGDYRFWLCGVGEPYDDNHADTEHDCQCACTTCLDAVP